MTSNKLRQVIEMSGKVEPFSMVCRSFWFTSSDMSCRISSTKNELFSHSSKERVTQYVPN